VRVVLFTGKGGVGKTTVSAATAALAAHHGRKTLVLSTDPAHSLADALATPLGAEPTEVDTGLYAQQVDTQRRFDETWRDVQHYLLSVLDAVGVDPIQAEELTVLPGAEEVLALLEVRNQASSGLFDTVVVDCAPTADTLRLLALPDAFGWYMDRIFPIERRLVRSLRPVLTRAAGVPMPHDRVFAAVERLHADLADVRRLLVEPGTSTVRLVLTPESVVVAEARRTWTSLSLYGYRVDAVVANRIFPAGSSDPWRAGWVRSQAEQLDAVAAAFAPLPVFRSSYRPAEPVGLPALLDVGRDLYRTADPFDLPPAAEPMTVDRDGDEFVLSVALPGVVGDAVDLARAGDDLVLTVGGRRRLLALPSALRRCEVVTAALMDGRLRIRFRPHPDRWLHP
jgi:arsenite-transporting ATPase